ncbi:MAG: UbiX family flavin prenyltransferase [candidate division KSB1 bacterium]|nr:UbiX family flavin prenyltransferase [candidate division KSB1 bacterium]MDZ7342575.1 UbiX family flavin prenyltransferase [candidate division KSB1 bacterium]
MKTYIVAITGASGVIIGIRLIEELISRSLQVLGIVTENATRVIEHEIGRNVSLPVGARYFEADDAAAPMNSSSFRCEAMIIAPCSMKTLANLASGAASNLVVRAAENQLRTHRPLILMPRETPLSLVQLQNMVTLKMAGAIICPPMAGYYYHPQSIAEMTNFFVGKILDLLELPNELYRHWDGS